MKAILPPFPNNPSLAFPFFFIEYTHRICSWNEYYANELVHFHQDAIPGDPWFGHAPLAVIVDYVCSTFPDYTTPMLDVGCGNGHLLLALTRIPIRVLLGNDVYTPQLHHIEKSATYNHLVGLDYSIPGIELACSLAQSCQRSWIAYHTFNLIQPEAFSEIYSSLMHTFECVMDKGTLDAISLSKNPLHLSVYVNTVHSFFRPHSDTTRFIIASCNWTRQELVDMFKNKFDLVEELHLPMPKFTFGGQQGNTVTILVFKPIPPST